MLYFVKRSKKAGWLGVIRISEKEKKLARELVAEGYKNVSRDTYRQARFALALF